MSSTDKSIVEDLKQKIKIAADFNIVVFDDDAGSGSFTKRLVALMKVVFLQNHNEKLYTIYVPPEFILEAHAEGKIMDRFYRPSTYMKVFGVNIQVMPEKLLEYYEKELGGRLASFDLELVLGENKTADKFLLGSY